MRAGLEPRRLVSMRAGEGAKCSLGSRDPLFFIDPINGPLFFINRINGAAPTSIVFH
jgi:hypothetical protein